MDWHHLPYTMPLVLAGVGTAVLAAYVLSKRRSPEIKTLALVMTGVAIWCLAYTLELLGSELQTKIFWAKFKYFGIFSVAPAWLTFSLQYTNRERFLSRRIIAFLGLAAIGMLLVIWTNEAHHLYWTSELVDRTGLISVLYLPMGPAFWLFAAYQYSLLLAGMLVIADFFIRSSGLYRKQAGAILLGAAAPWVGNAIFLADLSPYPHLDPTPFGFAITCLACWWALFRLHLADLLPVAHAAVIESMDDSLILLDMRNRILDLNPAAQRLVHEPGRKVIGEPLETAVPELPAQLRFQPESTLASQKVVLTEGDSRKIYDVLISPLEDRKGTVVSNVIVMRDITAQEHAEEELRRSGRRYRELYEGSRDGYARVTMQGTIVESNSVFRNMLGYSEKDLTTKTYKDITPEKWYPVEEEILSQQVLKRGYSILYEKEYFRKDGTVFPIEIRTYLIREENGEPSGMWAFVRDITDRKRLEAELMQHRENLEKEVYDRTAELLEVNERLSEEVVERKQAEEALRRSEERYHRILDSSHDMIAVMNREARILFANRAWQDHALYKTDKVNQSGAFQFLYPEDRQRVRQVFQALRTGGAARNLEFRVVGQNGEIRWREANVDPVDWPGVEPAFVIVLRDVTERKRIEMQLQQSSKLAAIGELASGVAHEINNPIAAIDVQTGLMRDIVEEGNGDKGSIDPALLQRLAGYLRTVEDQVQRCRSVTENLLSFARNSALEDCSVKINDLLMKTIELMVTLTDKDPKFDLRLDERLPAFQGNPNQLQQVFVNLLNNAVRAIDSDGEIGILTRLENSGSIRIEFRDSGCGMSPDIKERIFDPFFTTKPEGQGTGLGLSISYYIIQNMNGTIDVESSPGEGTTFTITLPISRGIMKGTVQSEVS